MTSDSDISGGLSCPSCGAGLAADQRYCLVCGERSPQAPPDARELLARTPAAAAPAAAGAAAPVAAAPARSRLELFPGVEVSLAVAIGVFALVLGVGAWAGAASVTPGRGPVQVAAAPAATTPATSAPATPGGSAAAPVDEAPADAFADVAPVDDTALLPADDASFSEPLAETPPADDTPAPTTPTTPAEEEPATTPTLKHVWIVALADQGYDALTDKAGAAPYFATTLAKKGALFSGLFGVTRGGLANTVALVSGQGPNPDTQADCPAYALVTPDTVGDDGQVEGRGCGYPSTAVTIADQIASDERAWRAYAGDVTAGAAAAQVPAAPTIGPCPKPVAGQPLALPRLPFLAFTAITDAPDCAERIVGLDRLDADLKSAKSAPALSYILPPRCADGRDEPCAAGAAAGVAPADAFLEDLVPKILASKAYADGGALIVLADQAAPAGAETDLSACCERSYYGKDQSTAGGGRVAGVLLSPYVKGGAFIDTPLDHYDLLKTLSEGLGVQPLGLAGRKEVTGVPVETWTKRPKG